MTDCEKCLDGAFFVRVDGHRGDLASARCCGQHLARTVRSMKQGERGVIVEVDDGR